MMNQATTFTPEFEAALKRYLQKANDIYTAYCSQQGFTHNIHIRRHVSAGGAKYLKIVVQRPVDCDDLTKGWQNDRSHSYIAMVDVPSKGIKVGDVLKGSWKAPEVKNPRGNILDGTERINEYGPVYLR